MRPSTTLRAARLGEVLDLLRERALPQAAIAARLRCSASAARNYVVELLAAGVIEAQPHGEADGRTYKFLYRLRADAAALAAFQARLAGADPCRTGRARAQAAYADPLVGALFGRRPAPAALRA